MTELQLSFKILKRSTHEWFDGIIRKFRIFPYYEGDDLLELDEKSRIKKEIYILK
jgi:hypothetical protein